MPRLDGTRQTGRRQHEWDIVAQTPRGQDDHHVGPYIEVDFCELCKKYRIFNRAADTEKIVSKMPDLPESYWL